MNDVLYEIRQTKVRRDKIQLVPYSDIVNHQGFRSLYGYGPEAVSQIRETNSTAGLTGAPVYSDLLLVDFDDNAAAGHKMAEELRAYDWVKFDSGGRSIHLHIRIDPMYGANTPDIQKEWMRQNYPQADLSIYRTAGIYRLAGTYHEKNPGSCKKVLEFNTTGVPLKIDVKYTAPVYVEREFVSNTELEDMLLSLLGREIGQGTTGRNYHVFKICKVCSKLGLSELEAERLVNSWNRSRCFPPLNNNSIEGTIRSAYKELTTWQINGETGKLLNK